MANEGRIESSHLGKSFQFKGDISGAEDIFIDGSVEGRIQLSNQAVTIGPQGSVNAEVHARDLVVQGKLKGNAQANDRIEVTRTGSVLGDLAMARLSIEEGAMIQGRVDVRTAGSPAKAAAMAAAAPVPVAIPRPEPVANEGPQQPSFLDRKF